MARYIDADLLMGKLSRMVDYCQKDNKVNGLTALFQVGDAIIDTPTADVVEVKHGKWILNERDRQRFGKVRNPEDYEHYCSCCNEEALCNNGDDSGSWWYLSDYCPNCGANMEKA